MNRTNTSGSFSDGTFHNGVVYFVTAVGENVVVYTFDGTTLTPFASFPSGGNTFARLESVMGQLWLAYRPQAGNEVVVRNLTTNDVRVYSGVFYNWPVCFGMTGYAVNFNGSAGPTTIFDYTHVPQLTIIGGRPDGINRVTDNNSGVLYNSDTGDDELAWGMLSPEYAGEVFVGESTGQFGDGIRAVYQSRVGINIPGILNPTAGWTEAFKPKVWQCGPDKWAIATTGPGYQEALLITEIGPADFGVVAPPPIDPPPSTGRVITIVGAVNPGDVIKVV